ASAALRPGLGELGPEQQNHGGIVDPAEEHRERPGRAERLARIALPQVQPDEELADHEQHRGEGGADPHVTPGHLGVGKHLEDEGEHERHTTSDTTWFTTCRSVTDSPLGRKPVSASPNAERTALTTSDTSSRKATLRIMPNENTRLTRNDLIPPWSGSGLT